MIKKSDPEEKYRKFKSAAKRSNLLDDTSKSGNNKRTVHFYRKRLELPLFTKSLKKTSPCVVCSEPGSALSCKTCSSAAYCSTTCQLKDANSDHHKCLPYSILYEERCGRLLMAARDISAGEILFTDIPGAVGPDNNPKPICLTCYKRLPGLVYRCRYCSWPLCSPFCQQDDGPHARECQLFRIHSPR